MNYPLTHAVHQQDVYRSYPNSENRVFPVVPFLTGLAFAPFLYGAFSHGGYYGGYYPYPPYPPYYPYGYPHGYGYGYNPYNYNDKYY